MLSYSFQYYNMKNKKINIEQEQKSTLAFMSKLNSIKKASKDIKQKNKLTVHRVEWSKQYKYLNKIERNMDKDIVDMFESLDLKLSKQFEEYQVFGRQNQKSYSQLYIKHKEKITTSNTNIWYQIDSLRSVISKLKQSPEFYVFEQVEGIIAGIKNFMDQLQTSIENQTETVQIPDFTGVMEEQLQQNTTFFKQKMLLGNQVSGFDVKKERVLKMSTNQNIFIDFIKDSDLQIDKQEETELVEEFQKAMGFLQQRYELQFQKLQMDYEDILNIDPNIIQSQNYAKLNHIYNSYIGRGKDRNLYSERLAIQFPNISRKNLDILTSYVEAKIYKNKKRKTLWRNFYKEKSELIDKAQQQILRTIEQKIENGKIEAQMLQRKQEQIKLGQKLSVLKKQYNKKKQQQQKEKLQQQRKKKQEEQREQKLWKEHTQQVGKKAQQYKKQIQQKRRQSDIVRKQQQKYERQLNKKKIIEAKPKVQVRQSMQRRKIEQKLQKKQEAIQSKILKQERIQNAIMNYSHRPNVDADFQRLKAPTTSLLNKKVQYDKADKVDLVKMHGYNIGQLMSDMRFRLNMALQDAGLSNAKFAKQVINQMSRPKQG